MRRLVYTKEAQDDLISILEHLASEAGGTEPGRRVVDRIRAKCRKFASLPALMGRPRPELGADLRSFVVGRYVVFLRYDGSEGIVIIASIEGHRDIDVHFQFMR